MAKSYFSMDACDDANGKPTGTKKVDKDPRKKKYKGRTVLGSQLRLNKAKDISELLSQCYLLFVAEEFLFNEANGAPATQGKHSEIIDLRQKVTYRKNREQKTHDSLSWQEEFQSYAQVLVFPLNPR